MSVEDILDMPRMAQSLDPVKFKALADNPRWTRDESELDIVKTVLQLNAYDIANELERQVYKYEKSVADGKVRDLVTADNQFTRRMPVYSSAFEKRHEFKVEQRYFQLSGNLHVDISDELRFDSRDYGTDNAWKGFYLTLSIYNVKPELYDSLSYERRNALLLFKFDLGIRHTALRDLSGMDRTPVYKPDDTGVYRVDRMVSRLLSHLYKTKRVRLANISRVTKDRVETAWRRKFKLKDTPHSVSLYGSTVNVTFAGLTYAQAQVLLDVVSGI